MRVADEIKEKIKKLFDAGNSVARIEFLLSKEAIILSEMSIRKIIGPFPKDRIIPLGKRNKKWRKQKDNDLDLSRNPELKQKIKIDNAKRFKKGLK